MGTIVKALSRRSFIRGLLALPLVRFLEKYWTTGQAEATAATTHLKVAKVSQLTQPWSVARFTYDTKIKSKDVYGKEAVNRERIPAAVIRLPDDLAEKRGGGAKGRFYVVNLHCSHERCETAYLTDKAEMRALSEIEANNPVAFCPCHRSVFDMAAEGKAIKGPAKEPLWKFDFDIKGDDIIVTGIDPKASVWEPGRPGGLTSEYPVRPGELGL